MKYSKDLINNAAWICCPMCDEKVCEGRFECDEIKKYLDRKSEEKTKNG